MSDDRKFRRSKPRKRLNWSEICAQTRPNQSCICPQCLAPASVHAAVYRTYPIDGGPIGRVRVCGCCGFEWPTVESNL